MRSTILPVRIALSALVLVLSLLPALTALAAAVTLINTAALAYSTSFGYSNSSAAQSFKTDATHTRVSEVTLNLHQYGGVTNGTYTVEIWNFDLTHHWPDPAVKRAVTVGNISDLSGSSANMVTISGLAIDLGANTNYYVVVSTSSSLNWGYSDACSSNCGGGYESYYSDNSGGSWSTGAPYSPFRMTVKADEPPMTTCTAAGSGAWNTVGTWDCGHVPVTGDDVIIPNGYTVFLDVDTNTLRHLTINAGGTLQHNGSDHSLSLTGNWSNSGVFNPSTRITVLFTGSGAQTLSGITAFCNLTVGGGVNLVNNGAPGSVTLTGSLSNSGTIQETFTQGSRKPSAPDAAGGLTGVATANMSGITALVVARQDSSIPSANAALATGYYWQMTPTGSGTVDISLPFTPPGKTAIANANRACYDVDAPGYPYVCSTGGSPTISGVSDTVLKSGSANLWAVGANAGPSVVQLSAWRAGGGQPALPWLALLFLPLAGLLLLCWQQARKQS